MSPFYPAQECTAQNKCYENWMVIILNNQNSDKPKPLRHERIYIGLPQKVTIALIDGIGVPFCMNKKEPKKSPAEDFFAWLHFATVKRNPDIYAGSPFWQKGPSAPLGFPESSTGFLSSTPSLRLPGAAQKSLCRVR